MTTRQQISVILGTIAAIYLAGMTVLSLLASIPV